MRFFACSKSHKSLIQFQRHVVTCDFEGEEFKYETWCRPMWDWIMDHLTDPELVCKFEWDAQKVFKYHDGGRSQIFTEPWTGKRFWEIQVRSLDRYQSRSH